MPSQILLSTKSERRFKNVWKIQQRNLIHKEMQKIEDVPDLLKAYAP